MCDLDDSLAEFQLLEELKQWASVCDQERKRVLQTIQAIEKDLNDVELGVENVIVGMQLLGSTRDIEYVRRSCTKL